MKKKITVFFDLEEMWEVPYRRILDWEKIVYKILNVLEKYDVKAVFNTCGIVAEEKPELIGEIHRRGHELASHGYLHENFLQMEPEELRGILARVENLLSNITGEPIVGVRSPWLLHDEKTYEVFFERGYKWASNKSITRIDSMRNPQKRSGLVRRFAVGLFCTYIWWKNEKSPYKVDGLTEIPLLSSMDGDLLGRTGPSQKTPKNIIEYAYESIKRQYYKSGNFFNLNFHPWLIGTSNRIELLKEILSFISNQNCNFVLAKEIIK